jgi:hypothetical protein
MIWPSKWRDLKGLSDIMALASLRRDDPRPYPTSPLFATEPIEVAAKPDTRQQSLLVQQKKLTLDLGRELSQKGWLMRH